MNLRNKAIDAAQQALGPDSSRSKAEKVVEAVLGVIREPDEAVLNKGPGEPYMDAHVWGEMIDVARGRCEVCGGYDCPREPIDASTNGQTTTA